MNYLSALSALAGLTLALPTQVRAQEPLALTVGSYVLNRESAFTPSAPTYTSNFALTAPTKLVVSFAPQYYTDFGIIPTADLRLWQQGRPARYLLRLSGVTAVRYISLPAGSYSVVARNRAATPFNGFTVKVRRFLNKVVDDSITRTYVSNKNAGMTMGPNSWNGMGFQIPAGHGGWLEGAFSRGSGRNVRFHLLTEAEYRRFVSGLSFRSIVEGSDPTKLGFPVNLATGRYFLIVINREPTPSALAITRELYR